MTTVTAAYVMGIVDERQMLNAEKAKGPIDASFARDMLANIEATLRQGFSGEMAEYMRGGRDFWRNQVKGARA
jgi:hypothetical protein